MTAAWNGKWTIDNKLFQEKLHNFHGDVPFSSGGETSTQDAGGSTDHVHEMLNDVCRDTIFDDAHKSSMNDDASNFYGYRKMQIKKCTRVVPLPKLGIIVRLFHIKCLDKVGVWQILTLPN